MLATALLLPLLLLAAPAPSAPPAPATVSPAPATAPPEARAELLVSTAWLAQHLADPQVVLVHVAESATDYKRGHLPGARLLLTTRFIDVDAPPGYELPPVEALAKVFSELGLGDTARVVIYTTAWQPYAARAWFTLDALGHGDRAALLDGGVERWLSEERPVVQQVPAFQPAPFTPRPRPAARATLEEVQRAAAADQPGQPGQPRLLDARPARRYEAGHLPGAASLYWQETLVSEEQPAFLPPERLRALYQARGLRPGDRLITYCEVGIQAAHAYFLARYLGHEVALYDGSYQDWTARAQPVVKGAAAR